MSVKIQEESKNFKKLGHDPSVVGVARLYAPLVATLVIDEADAGSATAVEAEGVRCEEVSQHQIADEPKSSRKRRRASEEERRIAD